MFANLFSWFQVRKAVYKWTSNKGTGNVKVIFRGPFSQAETRLEAVAELIRQLRDPEEFLESLDFVGIEA